MEAAQKSGVQSYRDMVEVMKKFQTTLDNLQDQAVELQLKFAEANFSSAAIFDPAVAAIVFESMGNHPSKEELKSQTKEAEDEDGTKSKEISDKYDIVCKQVSQNTNSDKQADAESPKNADEVCQLSD